MSNANGQYVCISVHDVAPSTWPDCLRLLAMLDSLGHIPITLLVVPDYHRQGRIDAYPGFLRAIEKRLARGDEVALHGYYHLDEAPPPREPISWVKRRVFTQSEGEFAAISTAEAKQRLEWGVELMKRFHWPVSGFVPPAWLLGKSAQRALLHFPFAYTTQLNGIVRLPHRQFTWSPALVYSVRSQWRRAMSRTRNRAQLRLFGSSPLLRMSLHPADAHFGDVVAQWRGFIEQVLDTHTPATKAVWIQQFFPV